MTNIKDARINGKDKRKAKKLGYIDLNAEKDIIEIPVVQEIQQVEIKKKKSKKEVV